MDILGSITYTVAPAVRRFHFRFEQIQRPPEQA
jgi:hypothetical protein